MKLLQLDGISPSTGPNSCCEMEGGAHEVGCLTLSEAPDPVSADDHESEPPQGGCMWTLNATRSGMINGEGIITGTFVSAAVIAAAAVHFERRRWILPVFGTAFIYWLAHLHARTLGDAVKHHKHPMSTLRERHGETWPILAAAVVPAVILIVVQLVGGTVNSVLDCRDRLHRVVDHLQLPCRRTERTQHDAQCRGALPSVRCSDSWSSH